MLDDAAALRKVDKGDMLGVLHGLPDQVRQSAASVKPGSLHLRGPWQSLLFSAMGGSAMGADMAALRLGAKGTLPCAVTRSYDPPHWAGRGTLVVAVSYSGNTEETLSCVKAAHARGAQVLAVTSGGELATWAQQNGGDLVRVPANLQPRAALGHLTFATLAALDGLGVAPLEKEAEVVAAHLERVRASLEPARPEAQNPSKQLAKALQHRLGFIYGAGPMEVAARRFATQLNENPKALAHWGPIPEVHHNELSAWFGDARLKDAALPVVFTAADRGTPLAAREQATLALMKEAGVQPHVLAATGDTTLARVFHGIYVGDYASVYLACLLGRDPTPVEAIVRLKARMAEFRKG